MRVLTVQQRPNKKKKLIAKIFRMKVKIIPRIPFEFLKKKSVSTFTTIMNIHKKNYLHKKNIRETFFILRGIVTLKYV